MILRKFDSITNYSINRTAAPVMTKILTMKWNEEEPQSQQRYSTRNSTRQNKHRHVSLSVAKSRRGKRSRKLKK